MIVADLVWFGCWDCGLDGIYPSDQDKRECPRCGGLMLQIYKPPRKDNSR